LSQMKNVEQSTGLGKSCPDVLQSIGAAVVGELGVVSVTCGVVTVEGGIVAVVGLGVGPSVVGAGDVGLGVGPSVVGTGDEDPKEQVALSSHSPVFSLKLIPFGQVMRA